MKIVFATSNPHKIKEMKQLLESEKNGIELLSLNDIGFKGEIVESGSTFSENAEIKSRAVNSFCGLPTIADDSGICVDALGGSPGIHSARYAGEGRSDRENLDKLLSELECVGDADRTARFECVIAYCTAGNETVFFEGSCEGYIARQRHGENGFGYDPIFIYSPENRSFAQLTPEEKNKFSHRAAAAEQFKNYIVKLSYQKGK